MIGMFKLSGSEGKGIGINSVKSEPTERTPLIIAQLKVTGVSSDDAIIPKFVSIGFLKTIELLLLHIQ